MESNQNKMFDGRVKKSAIIAQGVKRISFEVTESLTFAPMQYAWVEILSPELVDVRGSRRAFVMLPSTLGGTFDVIARISDSGYKQSLFALKSGDRVRIHGPFGTPYELDRNNLPEHILMVVGGTGVVNSLTMIDVLRASGQQIPCTIIYLNRSREVTPFIAELTTLQRQFPWLHVNIDYQSFSWQHVSELATQQEKIEWWIVGPQGMVDSVFKILEDGGVSRQQMRFGDIYPIPEHNLTKLLVEKQLEVSNIFASALQNSTNHTIITDANGVILFANHAAQKITGYAESEMFGQTPRLWGGMMSTDFYKRFWEQKKSGKPFSDEIINRRKNGEIYHAIAHISPIVDDENHIIGFIGTEEDISALRNQEAATKKNEQRLNFALEASQSSLWDWDIAASEIYLSRRYQAMLGAGEQSTDIKLDDWLALIHADDLTTVKNHINNFLEGTEKYLELRYRMIRADGTIIWMQTRGAASERDQRGRPLRAIGTHIDISQSAQREHELERLNTFMVDRELKMIELKKELARLKSTL